jgi:hypothetical protein
MKVRYALANSAITLSAVSLPDLAPNANIELIERSLKCLDVGGIQRVV